MKTNINDRIQWTICLSTIPVNFYIPNNFRQISVNYINSGAKTQIHSHILGKMSKKYQCISMFAPRNKNNNTKKD